jgi:5'-nucleotidase
VWVVAAAAATAGCTVDKGQYVTAGQDVKLSLFHTTDWHSRIIPYAILDVGENDRNQGLLPENSPFGGAARLATLLKCARIKDVTPSKIPPACCCLQPSMCPGFDPTRKQVCCTRQDGTCSGCEATATCGVDPGDTFTGLTGSDRFAYLDSGDLFQGAPIFNAYAGEVEMRVMSYLRPDAVVVGNHEFDKGIDNYANQLVRWSNFPTIVANYMFNPARIPAAAILRDKTTPFVILNLDGVRVGVIGMGNFSSMVGIFRGDNNLGLEPLNPFQILQDLIDFLRPQVDFIIALSHMGLRGDDNFNPEDEELIHNTSGIGLLLGGHLHILLEPPKIVLDCVGPRCSRFGKVAPRPVLLMHSGAFLKYGVRLDVVIRDQNMVSYKQFVYPIDKRIPEDAIMNSLLEPYVFGVNRMFDLTRVHAYDFDKLQRFDPSGGDSQLGNLVCESMQKRRRVETDFCMTNSLGIRDVFPSGPLTDEQLFNVLPFENFITTMFLSGKEIQELYDYVTFRSADRGCNTQAQVASSTFVMNCAKIRAERITVGGSRAGCFTDDDCGTMNPATGAPGGEICTDAKKICPSGCEKLAPDGSCAEFCCPDKSSTACLSCFRPIDPDASYALATNDYIAAGGSGFLVLQRNTTQFNTGISMRQAVIDFVAKQKTCPEATNAGLVGVPCINGQDPTTPWATHDGRITRITSQ